MAFDLKHYQATYADTNKGNFDNDAILNRYPFICSREALYQALDGANLANNSQRNPNGYTVKQLTDKIIAHWDQIMAQNWDRGVSYNNPRPFADVVELYNWSQSAFWSNSSTSFIALNEQDNGPRTAAQIVGDVDIIILPQTIYTVDTVVYKQKPFLAFDTNGYIAEASATSATLIGTDDFGVELDVNSDSRVTGITSSGTTDDPTAIASGARYGATLLHVYDFNFYHDDLNVNGSDFSVNPAYTGHDNLATSTKWFDLRRAKFSVTISTSGGTSGQVTAITPVSVNDGSGAARTGGWDYQPTTDDYYELFFVNKLALQTNTQLPPRVLFRTNTAADNGKGMKATVDITDKESEFFEGKALTSAYIDTAFAVPTDSLVDKGHSHSLSATSDDSKEWFERNWPSPANNIGVDPAVVRIISERPSLTSSTRSFKTTTTGTGAHRFRFEFEYPPMEYSEAQHYIEKFESFKADTLPLQLYIPSTAIQHYGKWSSEQTTIDDWPRRQVMDSAAKGSDTMILNGHTPNTPRIPDGTYFFSAMSKKLYQIVGAGAASPDIYGRVPYLVEPPFITDQGGDFIKNNNKDKFSINKNYLLIKAFLEDNTLNYTVDAAGIYRMTFKFREAVDE
tara:strand:+ start:4685 stop:6553 length:1869 start_codon:yes stop_codon:yes gene_type:complete